jgi:hypothetical protein
MLRVSPFWLSGFLGGIQVSHFLAATLARKPPPKATRDIVFFPQTPNPQNALIPRQKMG